MARFTRDDAVIWFSALPLVVGRSPECDLYLSEPTVSRRHARLLLHGEEVVLEDLGSRYGTFVNGARVRDRVLRPEDRVRFGLRMAYVVRGGGLYQVGERELAGPLSLEGVSLLRQGQLLVEGVSADFVPGRLSGILGPSGAGKSLLLKAAAGLYPPDGGGVKFAGSDVWDNPDQDWYRLGFVPQSDVLFESLTVEENLEFAARLRLGRENAAAQQEAVVQAMEMLQLLPHAKKKVAVLSGGQRKRASVAIELLGKPAALLLDEPVSGLDPANEARLLETLRRIAQRGLIVICSTHSLSSIRLFDEVLVLGVRQGTARAAFFGPPEDLEKRFGGRHWADWFDLLEAGRFADEQTAAGDSPASRRSMEAAAQSAKQPPALLTSPAAGATVAMLRKRLAHHGQTPGFVRQWLDVTLRSWKVMGRDRGLLLMMALQPVLLGALVVLTQYNPGRTEPILFFSVVIAIWLGMNNTVRDLVRERKQYIRDRSAGLQADAYLGAKITAYLAIGALQIALLVVLVRIGCRATLDEALADELRETPMAWWWLTLMMLYLCGAGLGMLASTLAGTEEAAVAALPVLILPQILLSGVATGDARQSMERARGFRPIVVTLRLAGPSDGPENKAEPLGWPRATADFLSLGCYSRPGLLALTAPVVRGFHRAIWWGDVCHLLVLLAATYAATWFFFLKRENTWPALVHL